MEAGVSPNNHRPASWRVVGAAVQGTSHQKAGLPCQDAQVYLVLPDGALIVALADGAGSASKSDAGARCAAETIVTALSDALSQGYPQSQETWEDVLYNAFEVARGAVFALAVEAGDNERDYAATLTCAVNVPGWLVVGQIGDGAVVAREQDEPLYTATTVQRGEYANETNFLTQEDALDHLEIRVLPGNIQALAAMSDGLTRLALSFPSHTPHPPFFQPLFSFAAESIDPAAAAEKLAGFLSSERVNARTDDDKSLVLAVRVNEHRSPPAGDG